MSRLFRHNGRETKRIRTVSRRDSSNSFCFSTAVVTLPIFRALICVNEWVSKKDRTSVLCIAIVLSIVNSSDTLNNTSMQNKSYFSQSDEQRISCSFSLMFDRCPNSQKWQEKWDCIGASLILWTRCAVLLSFRQFITSNTFLNFQLEPLWYSKNSSNQWCRCTVELFFF